MRGELSKVAASWLWELTACTLYRRRYVALARCVPGGDEYKPSYTQITEENFRKYYFTSWYTIHMTQANGSELPVQQQGMPVIYGLMTLLSAAAALAQVVAARGMRQSESFHPIMKLLTLVVVFFCVSNVLLFLHFYVFQFTGVGVPLFEYSAKMLQVFVRVGTILLAMLVAKGWTINSVALEGQEKLSCLMITILGLYLSMAMWYLVWLDPASTLYIYDSWPGIGICLLLLGVLVWFVHTILDTRAFEEGAAKRRFFLQVRRHGVGEWAWSRMVLPPAFSRRPHSCFLRSPDRRTLRGLHPRAPRDRAHRVVPVAVGTRESGRVHHDQPRALHLQRAHLLAVAVARAALLRGARSGH